MSRPRGGIIAGTLPAWTTTATSGLFTLREAQELRAANTWPRGPDAPTSLVASAGNAQLSLSWTAPATTYGTITNYLVEYTASGGSPQYVLTNSTSTSYTLTGLTSGTAYTVRVAAVNFTAGDYSSAVTGTPASVSLVLTGPDSANYTGNGTAATPFARTINSWGFQAGNWLVMPNEATVRFTVSGGAATFRMTYRSGETDGDGGGEIFLRRRSSGGTLLSQTSHGGWGGGSDSNDRSFTQTFNSGDYMVFNTNGYGGRIWLKAVWIE